MKEKRKSMGSKIARKEIMAVAERGSKTSKRSAYWRNKDSRSRFLKNLMVKKEEVEKALGRLMDSQKESKGLVSGDRFIEELDQAEREISSQKYYRLLERKNEELAKIETLIGRVLGDEEFGLCEECGRRIPEERLLIVPEATRCVICQQELEKLDSKRSHAERSSHPSGGKKGLHWDYGDDSNHEGEPIDKTDLDHILLEGLHETDLDEYPEQKNDEDDPNPS